MYIGRQKYSARFAKVLPLLRTITTVTDVIERSSFFYFKRYWGLLYTQLNSAQKLLNYLFPIELNLPLKSIRFISTKRCQF
jgi:hypothetical protein